MRRPVLLYVITLIAYLAIDSVWLRLTSVSIYRATLGPILLPGFRPGPATAVYLLQVLGLMVFVMPRAETSGRASTAFGYGMCFGIFTYGLYGLTNFATLRDWTLPLACIDIAWGGVVSGLASVIGWSVATRIRGRRKFI